jgi:two-component system, LuxR family, response regulator DctR
MTFHATPTAAIHRFEAQLDAAPTAEPRPVEDTARLLATLSTRQMQVLALVFVGALNKTIADQLGIGIRTVETHRARMMQKMQARSINELIAMVVQLQERAHAR